MSQSAATGNRIRVLIVDDSPTVQRVVIRLLQGDPELEVVGTAIDPYEARDKILELQPDVLTLDLEMPRMDGLTFLRLLMQKRPMPVIVMSSLTPHGSDLAIEALEAGAVDVLGKPYGSHSVALLGRQLAERLKTAVRCRVRPSPVFTPSEKVTGPKGPSTIRGFRFHPRQLIVLGASTGGTEALRQVLTRLPGDLPPIAIVQHIPAGFSRTFAERLNALCRMEVREAVNGEPLLPGLALVAPGDFHLLAGWAGRRFEVTLRQGPPVWHQRPAVDVLFKSATEASGKRCVAGLLTGMGRDGADGLLRLKGVGAMTLAQNEASGVVYGMPKAAVELGAVNRVVSLEEFPAAIVEALQNEPARAPGSTA
jgi:two-component system, chemotaxis family, protein-glutamate methylesterase/glutaminase